VVSFARSGWSIDPRFRCAEPDRRVRCAESGLPLLNPLSTVYGQVARFRRHWYEQRPHLQRQLGCPVVSVGNLVVGGSGKTPVVALLAALLRDAGYAPAILSRGYKRRGNADVVIVSDRHDVRAAVDASGDEPQMLARRLPGVPVIVSPDRYHAGSVARQQLGANVLILDDGFQHLQVARTVNLLLLSSADLAEAVLPTGRLREPIDAATRADALLVSTTSGDPSRLAQAVGVDRAFAVVTSLQPLRRVTPFGATVSPWPSSVVTLAAIARPERLADSVRGLGFTIEQQFTFRDHHWFSPADVRRVEAAALAAGADAIVTTEKDAVRLEPVVAESAIPTVFLPIDVCIEPADEFRAWLLDRIGPPGARQ
jgi:tetraacyldisaccharide 4'-kinase